MTTAEAIRMLPPGSRIHTFLGLIGADWDADLVIVAILASKSRERSTGVYAEHGHGLTIEWKGRQLAIQTHEDA